MFSRKSNSKLRQIFAFALLCDFTARALSLVSLSFEIHSFLYSLLFPIAHGDKDISFSLNSQFWSDWMNEWVSEWVCTWLTVCIVSELYTVGFQIYIHRHDHKWFLVPATFSLARFSSYFCSLSLSLPHGCMCVKSGWWYLHLNTKNDVLPIQ